MLKAENLKVTTIEEYITVLNSIILIINRFFDNREETEKDIWNCLNIKGTKIAATCARKGYTINFLKYPECYRECMKKYFKTIITKKSVSQCLNIHVALVSFFENFKEIGYTGKFLKELSREDMKKYIIQINNKYKEKNQTYVGRLITYPRTFLEYIQLKNYEEAPKKEIELLIYPEDIPKREKKYEQTIIPMQMLQQIDSSITDLDRPELIPIYMLLRETGWRGIDILNLRYDNYLEKTWNKKEGKYSYYLCGKTINGTANIETLIEENIAQMIDKLVKKAEETSNEDNNPNKYLFNVYKGKLKGRPIPKDRLTNSIDRLIKSKNIKNEEGKYFHFRMQFLAQIIAENNM